MKVCPCLQLPQMIGLRSTNVRLRCIFFITGCGDFSVLKVFSGARLLLGLPLRPWHITLIQTPVHLKMFWPVGDECLLKLSAFDLVWTLSLLVNFISIPLHRKLWRFFLDADFPLRWRICEFVPDEGTLGLLALTWARTLVLAHIASSLLLFIERGEESSIYLRATLESSSC